MIERSNNKNTQENRLFKYFKEMQLTDQQMAKILKKLQYEFMRQGKDVFKHGDMGDKFYMIIAGGVGIFVPQAAGSKNSPKKKLTRQGSMLDERESKKSKTRVRHGSDVRIAGSTPNSSKATPRQ